MKNTPFSRLLIFISAVLLFGILIFTVHNIQAAGTTSTISEVDSDGIVGVGTAVVTNSAGQIVIAYFDATNLDLKLAVCDDSKCYSPDIEIVDGAGDVGVSPAMTITADDRPVISYFDIANGNLKLAVCDDPDCTSATIKTVDNTANVGIKSDIVLDNAGRPIISYYDVTNSRLKIAYCNNLTCNTPNLVVVDDNDNPGLFSSVTIDDDGLAVIAYYADTNQDLKIAFCNDGACSAPVIKTLDAQDDSGRYASIAIISGRIFVSYFRTDGSGDNIKVARCNDFDCTSVTVLHLIEMQAAQYSSMVMNDQGQLFISFLDAAQGDLVVAACIVDPTSGCKGATFTRVDRFFFTGLHTSITLDQEGTPIISYHDLDEEALNVASCPMCRVPARNDIGPVSSQDSIALVMPDSGYPIMTYQDSMDNNFYIVFCQDTTCENFNKTSIGTNLHINPSIALQPNGRPAVAYYHAATNELKYTICNNDDCTNQTTNVIDFDGYDPSLQFDSNGLPIIAYYDASANDLLVAYCNEPTCATPGWVILDDTGDVGQQTSMVLGPDDNPIISYYDATNDTVKFVICDDRPCGFRTFKTAQITDGPYNDLALADDGTLHLFYYDNNGKNLRHLYCDLPCDGTAITVVDPSTTDAGWDISLVLDENGLPLVSYYDNESGVLRMATCLQKTCLQSTLGVVDTINGNNGRFSQIALNNEGMPVIAHANLSSPSARIVVFESIIVTYQVFAPAVLGQ